LVLALLSKAKLIAQGISFEVPDINFGYVGPSIRNLKNIDPYVVLTGSDEIKK
jgi:hypothetical protein